MCYGLIIVHVFKTKFTYLSMLGKKCSVWIIFEPECQQTCGINTDLLIEMGVLSVTCTLQDTPEMCPHQLINFLFLKYYYKPDYILSKKNKTNLYGLFFILVQ